MTSTDITGTYIPSAAGDAAGLQVAELRGVLGGFAMRAQGPDAYPDCPRPSA